VKLETRNPKPFRVLPVNRLFHRWLIVLLLSVFLRTAHAQEQRYIKVVAITDEPHYSLLLDNDKTRVWRFELRPGEESTLVKHDYDYAVIGLSVAEVEPYNTTGTFPKKYWYPGYTQFFAARLPSGVRNSGESYFAAIVVEVKQPGLRGGNVNDIVDLHARLYDEFPAPLEPEKTFTVRRVSNPVVASLSQILPRSHLCAQGSVGCDVTEWQSYQGPQLFIAITDLDLLSESETDKSTPIEISGGELAWVRPQGKRRLRNVGSNVAVVVVMEFR
jgi:hypothetical protein